MTPGLLEPVVHVRDACVRFGRARALAGVSFDVDAGRVLAIVGANGAGKSTLFRALAGLHPLDAGEVRLFGHPAAALPAAVRERVAYVSEAHAEMAEARVRELVAFRRVMYRAFDEDLVRELTARAGIAPGHRFGELSRGQRALTVVSLALAQSPDLLLLDDPTLGLDPLARRGIVQAVLGVARTSGTTVVVATHEIADVERLADDVLLLSRGRVASEMQEVSEFVARAAVVALATGAPPDEVAAIEGVLYVWPRRDHLEVVLTGDEDAREEACRKLSQLARDPDVLAPRAVSLEEATLAWLARDSAQEASHA